MESHRVALVGPPCVVPDNTCFRSWHHKSYGRQGGAKFFDCGTMEVNIIMLYINLLCLHYN